MELNKSQGQSYGNEIITDPCGGWSVMGVPTASKGAVWPCNEVVLVILAQGIYPKIASQPVKEQRRTKTVTYTLEKIFDFNAIIDAQTFLRRMMSPLPG